VNAIGAAGLDDVLNPLQRVAGVSLCLSSDAEYSRPELTHAIAWLDHGLEDDGTWDAVALMNG
jgi:hypothetical protein